MRTTTALTDGRIYVTLHQGAVDLRTLTSDAREHVSSALNSFAHAPNCEAFQRDPLIQASASTLHKDVLTILEDLALRLHLEDTLGEAFQVIDLPVWRIDEMRAYVESALAA